jgi:hypothetical protein
VIDKNGNFLRQWKPEGMETVHCLLVALGARLGRLQLTPRYKPRHGVKR